MNENYDTLEELSDFLEGTFHQDMGSPEQALKEFIAESSKECLVFTIKFCEEFLNENISDQEKESFIKSNTEIYFPAIDLTPLQWLKKVITEIKEAI
ncbi:MULTISPECIES: contact-dependent growth inhibition system immunity protein [Bacillus]|uniref:contact-dependent growth inhibition system immunity protein n=1 Tax=Bacillus TaxID=1386 RepID=UPI00076BB5E5|nr:MULTISPECIES: contact-dependent growth inhibition system immunity protein [Bacillus subtilis group]MDX7994441.1 contact-dependent growth inhibition system immunity protein [Bacillus subtilis]MEB3693108.1 contact-dependent growth inhibition system immunity protein [Bacillus amyloliquefaciens]WMW44709.1 contact-dependent growth inhibition system immunity protein [Bacillus subtilis]